jgi:hypothetical protein
VVTGGGDSVINVWEDVTAEEEEAALAEAEALVEKEQALANLVRKKEYAKVRGDEGSTVKGGGCLKGKK